MKSSTSENYWKKATNIEDFVLNVFPMQTKDPHCKKIRTSAYQLWREVWFPTLKELDNISSLSSDGFTRQDYGCLIEYKGAAAGLCCFRLADLNSTEELDDSWFQPWPKALLDELASLRSSALIPSWLTVHPSFRKSNGHVGPSISLILAELISLNCLTSSADIAFGTPRIDRSVDEIITKAGGTTLLANVPHHNVDVNLVAFFPENLIDHKFSYETMNLWNRKNDFRITKQPKETRYEPRELI